MAANIIIIVIIIIIYNMEQCGIVEQDHAFVLIFAVY